MSPYEVASISSCVAMHRNCLTSQKCNVTIRISYQLDNAAKKRKAEDNITDNIDIYCALQLKSDINGFYIFNNINNHK